MFLFRRSVILDLASGKALSVWDISMAFYIYVFFILLCWIQISRSDEIRCLMHFANCVVDLIAFFLLFILGKTNKEFNLRHDWNSLISDDEALRMTRYSKEFFPHADVLVNLCSCVVFFDVRLVLPLWEAIKLSLIRSKSISILPLAYFLTKKSSFELNPS